MTWRILDTDNVFEFNVTNGGDESWLDEDDSAQSFRETLLKWAIFLGILVLIGCFDSRIPFPHRCIPRLLTSSSQSKKRRRYEAIEQWLISKRVMPHTATCDEIQRQFRENRDADENCVGSDSAEDPKDSFHEETDHDDDERHECKSTNRSIKRIQAGPSATSNQHGLSSRGESITTASYGTEYDRECPLCMESFVAGDIVSWTPIQPSQGYCPNVFHHECIKEWLLNHTQCHCCKKHIIPVDDYPDGNIVNKKTMNKLVEGRKARMISTSYCEADGLLTLQRPNERLTSDCLERMREFTWSYPTKSELEGLRGKQRTPSGSVFQEVELTKSQVSPSVQTTTTFAGRETAPSLIKKQEGSCSTSVTVTASTMTLSHRETLDSSSKRLFVESGSPECPRENEAASPETFSSARVEV